MYYGERFNSYTHLTGAVAALAGLVILVVYASLQGDPWKIVSASIYGSTLLLLYTFSTLFHSLKGKAKRIFQKLDHFAIYLLIAGTYTPFTLVTLRGNWGWTLFGINWGLAVVGIVVDSLPRKKRGFLPIFIYLVMGWSVLMALGPLLKLLPLAGFVWLLTGGIFYTLGILFFSFDERVPHFHGIWHIFVIIGSLCHFISILFYVIDI